MIHESLAEISEGELVKRLIQHPLHRSDLFQIAGGPRNAVFRDRVSLDGAPGGFLGEVDVLLCEPTRPDLSVAVQVKRVKFGPAALQRGFPNKLHEFHKAVEQANRDARVGFAQVYLYVFVVVDSREQNLGKNRYGGLNNMMKSLLYTEMSLERLDPRVGFYQIEMTQCWDDSALGSGTWGGHLRRTAQPITQSEELTAWVRAKMAEGPLL